MLCKQQHNNWKLIKPYFAYDSRVINIILFFILYYYIINNDNIIIYMYVYFLVSMYT